MNLKEELKAYAYRMGADLVGFGNIERCANAPLMMSPQGIFPGARTVLVMGLRHPDACIELGGESHPQNIGPYTIQYLMNSRLDELSYRMATFIEKKGYGAIPICSSNIWRYNKYKELNAVFAPDVSNIYMPVVAGLADMGYSGLALTPEYGARNRFVTVITDAIIAPDPLIRPGTVCDKCMLCKKHCPSAALSKEIDGEKVLKIENYEYRFANKNLWRCAWGEHFDLDLDLKIPEVVTEDVIVETVKKHGIRSGEMGQCLKFCVPRGVRIFDRSYSKTPMRKYCVDWDESIEPRNVCDKFISQCYEKGIQYVVVHSATELAKYGIDIEQKMPGAQSAITLICARPYDKANLRAGYCNGLVNHGMQYLIDSVAYDLCRNIEDIGFRSLTEKGFFSSVNKGKNDSHISQKIAEFIMRDSDDMWFANTVYSRKRFPERKIDIQSKTELLPSKCELGSRIGTLIKNFAYELGADLVGVSSARRIAELSEQLKKIYQSETVLSAKDKSHRFKRWEPEISEDNVCVFNCEDYLPGAKSVIVIGLRFHKKVLEFATKPPAEAVGPYAFQTYITRWHGTLLAAKIAMKINEFGYNSVITADLCGLGSEIASPRGFIEDNFSNRFAAIAAGLGTLTKSGHVLTEKFGIRQRFIAIVTDAEIEEDELCTFAPQKCVGCDACVKSCPTKAISDSEIVISCDGVRYKYNRINRNLCEWSKRYALSADSGFKYLGSNVDENPQGKVTPAKLAEALKKHDPIKKYRPVACEPCVINCLYS